MPHNSLIYGGPTDPTAWMPGHVLTQLDLQTIDQTLFECINGDLGGTWAPADTIVIGGAGMQVVTSASGNFTVIGSAGAIDLYSGTVTITPAGGVVVGGAAEFAGLVTVTGGGVDIVTGVLHVGGLAQVDGDLFVGDDISVTGDVTVTGALGAATAIFSGAVIFNGTVAATSIDIASGDIILDASSLTCTIPASFSDATNFTGGVTFALAGSVALAGPVSLTGIITPSGSGRMLDRVYNLPDLSVTVSIADGNYFVVPALGASRTYTLSTTGAQIGDRVCFDAWANSTANIAGVGVWNLLSSISGQEVVVWFRFDGAAWQKSDVTYVP